MDDMLVFRKVSLSLGKTPILKDFDLTLKKGEHKVIMGPSGCGKTSVLRLAAGLLKPDHGRVIRNADKVSMQFQEPRLIPWLTAAENINLVLSDSKTTMDQAIAWLHEVGLAEAAHKLPGELSGGMAQRVALARAMAFGGELYLLDEPFRGLDQSLRDEMIALVKKHTQGASLLLVTHDMAVAEQFGGASVTF